MSINTGTAAANRLTATWARRCEDTSTVFSGAGVWPLLALLAAAAEGPARAELTAAAGVPAGDGHRAAAAFLASLAGSPSTAAAFGTWTATGLPVTDWWRAAVPPGVHGELTGDPDTDNAALARWVTEHTAGRITEPPLKVDAATALLLMTALSARTTWAEPFTPGVTMFGRGPTARRAAALWRQSRDVDDVVLAASPAGTLTLFTARGDDDLDVVLVLGEEDRPAGEVLAAACTAAAGTPGSRLAPGTTGPGLTVRQAQASTPDPVLVVQTVPFAVDATHDLLRLGDLFGLVAATRKDGDHFPRISTELYVSAAVQQVLAGFTAEGFYAAAVTALAMMATGAPMYERTRTEVVVAFDRPFGFLAVHRPTGLVLVAGWVAEAPEPAPDEW